MRVVRLVLAGLAVGFLVGIALSELVIGVVAFDREIGIKYLALILAAAFAIAAPVRDGRRRRGNGS